MGCARVAIAAAACAGATAHAHPEKFPKRDRLELSPTEARVTIDYVVPAGDEARALHEIFDRDRSGALDAQERAAIAEYLAAQATRFVTLTVDDRAIALERIAAEPALDGAAGTALATTVTLAARVVLGGGAHRIRLADRHKDRRVTVPVVVALVGLSLAGALPPGPVAFADHPVEVQVTAIAK